MSDSTARTKESYGNSEQPDQVSDKESNSTVLSTNMGNALCPDRQPEKNQRDENQMEDAEEKPIPISEESTGPLVTEQSNTPHRAKKAADDQVGNLETEVKTTKSEDFDQCGETRFTSQNPQGASKDSIETQPNNASANNEALDTKTEFSIWCKKNKLNAKIIRRLKTEDLDNFKTLRKFNENQIGTLKLNPEEETELRRALQTLHSDNITSKSKPRAEQTPNLYDKAFNQFLIEMSLDQKSRDKLKTFGVNCPAAMMLLKRENIDELQLTSTQIKVLEDIIAGFNMHSSMVKSSQLTSAAGIEQNMNDTFCDAVHRFQMATKDVTQPGIANLTTYLQCNHENQKLEKTFVRNGMKIIKLPVEQIYKEPTNKIRKCVLGRSNRQDPQKTIMVVGATGVGKSTLIDGMCNYLFGVQWDEKHRFQLIDQHEDEIENEAMGQTVSQTEWITIYTICTGESNSLPYTLNVIDTPGFGDTRGIERDQQLVKQIQFLFENKADGINEIDAVCFVAKAPDARLTPTQRFIFNSILSIFGKNIEVNILVMVTFADATKAPVIDALNSAKLPYSKAFTFNNSALLTNYDIATDFTAKFGQMFWDMGMESFNTFFDCLGALTPKSLCLASEDQEQRQKREETLREQQRLNGDLEEVEKHVRNRLSNMAQYEEEGRLFKLDLNQINIKKHTSDKLCENVDQLKENIVVSKRKHDMNEAAVRKYIREGHKHSQILRKKPLTDLEYIENFIQAEKNQLKDGWRKRVEQLEEIKRTWLMFKQATTDSIENF